MCSHCKIVTFEKNYNNTMKKIILATSATLIMLQCAPDGGNKGILKRGPEVERYDDANITNGEHHGTATSSAHKETSLLKSSIEWTAFKTKEKSPVKGSFTSIELHQEKKEGLFLETLEGATVNISGMSVSSGDPVRDENLKNNFFGKFENEIKIHFGKFEKNKVEAHITINGKIIAKTISYIATDNEVKLDTTLDIVKDLNLSEAFASISEACKAYHQNKTWSEVVISASISK